MKASNVVPVNLGSRSYKIHILPGLIQDFSTLLAETVSPAHIVIITDDVVENLYLAPVKKCLQRIPRIDSIVVNTGEKSKSVAQCDQLWQRLVELKTDRKSVILALGGGVIGDLAGFIAASYARGLGFVQIPTTLLAQVDSSVGGKVGINLPQAKNMVGAFWQPQTVLIDPRVLTTLDQRNYRAGLAEVVKYGVIMDVPLFEFLEDSVDAINNRDPETLSKVIAWCCRCKSSVVEADETETSGRREILNYGHTFGHAIEAVFGYGEYLHGEAIAIGMTCAARLAASSGLADRTLLERQSRLFESFGLPTRGPVERRDELVNAMKHDKKTAAGKLNLILPTKLGNVQRIQAPDDTTLRNCFSNGSIDE